MSRPHPFLFILLLAFTLIFTQTASSQMNLSVQPDTLLAGKKYNLTLAQNQPCNKDTDTSFDGELLVVSSTPSDLVAGTVTKDSSNHCHVFVNIKVDAAAIGGSASLQVKRKSDADTVLALLQIKVLSATPVPSGPVPPGLPPQLDIMWKILPRQAVADSYGSRVADGFFAVEATFGNSTGYDLQIAALGFIPPKVTCQSFNASHLTVFAESQCKQWDQDGVAKKYGYLEYSNPTLSQADDPPLPVDAYPVVRGTVEREQFVGTRALIVNLVKATGPLLVGVGGVFSTLDPLRESASIFSTFFEKGLELVYPDLTTRHLISLDNRTLRDGAIIPNNTAMRINAFISRELVQCGFPRRWYRPIARSTAKRYDCMAGDTRLPYSQVFDPNDVMGRLGKMTLIGQQIAYINRIRVVQGEPKIGSPASPLITGNALALLESTKSRQVFAGINLQNAKVVSTTVVPDLAIEPATPAPDGSSITFDITTPAYDPKGPNVYPLIIQTPYGSTPATLQVLKKT